MPRTKDIVLKWWYSSGTSYDYHSSDSAQMGQMYRLKVLERDIRRVELWSGKMLVIEWEKKEGDE
jgi:hypothetical protein